MTLLTPRPAIPQTTVRCGKIQPADGDGVYRGTGTAVAYRPTVYAGLLSSTLIWTFLWLVAMDAAISYGKPLRYAYMGGYVLQDSSSVRAKLERLNLPWFNPDLLVIGSSLSQTSFACADALMQKRRAPNLGYETSTNARSVYLEEQLSKLTGKKHSSLELSVGGCMASDAYFLLRRVLSVRSSIRVLVLPMAPRDFQDNSSCTDPEKSPVAAYLKRKSMDSLVSPSISVEERFERALAFLWHYFDIKADYQRLLRLFACQTLGRAPDPYWTAHFSQYLLQDNRVDLWPPPRSAGEVLPWSVKKRDARACFRQYNPYNRDGLQTQFSYLEKTLSLCHERDITAIIIDMPLSEINRRQMSPDLRQQYQFNLKSLSRKYAVHLVSLQDDSDFLDSDFRDSRHMVGTGGKKTIDRTIAVLAKDRDLVSKLRH